MYKITVINNCNTYNKVFFSATEAEEYANRMVKAHRTFDIYRDGELVGTGDGDGIHPIRRVRRRLTGSIGYAQMMSEER